MSLSERVVKAIASKVPVHPAPVGAWQMKPMRGAALVGRKTRTSSQPPAAVGRVKGDRLADTRQSQPDAALREHGRVAVVGEGVGDDRDDRRAGRGHLESELGPVVVVVVDEEAGGVEHGVAVVGDVRLPREVARRRRSHEYRRRAHGASADRVDEPVRLRRRADDEPSRLGGPRRGRAQPLELERHRIERDHQPRLTPCD